MYEELRGDLAAWATHFHFNDETSLLLCKAADAIEELDNKLNLHRQGKISHWIPVTERLPEIGKKVLVFAYGHDILTARMTKLFENVYPVFECNGIFREMAKPGRITHWMPLPEPPEEDKDGAE